MITLRVEIMTVQRMTEEEIDEPEGWSEMAAEQRRAWCQEAVEDMRSNLVGTSYNYPGQDADDAEPAPPTLADCTSCGATDWQCRKIMAVTKASRSCCSRCKMTDTHPPLGGR